MAGERILNSLSSRIMELDDLIEKQDTKQGESHRFADDEDTENFVFNMRNANTARKTESDIRLMKSFFGSIGRLRNPETIPTVDLGTYLARFFLNVRKTDGSEYEPISLKGFQSSVNRYLSEKNYGVNILTDERFKHSRDVLAAKCKNLKQQGKGNKPQEADALTKEEISILYQSGQLGTGSPTSLIQTMWWNNTTHFGLRSRQEHIDMRWGDVQLMTSSTGLDYLQYSERQTKTRTGLSRSSRPFPPKMFAMPDNPRCPVAAFKEYARRRPANMDEDSAFYLAVNQNAKCCDAQWFSRQNMGKNKIGGIMKSMCNKANITGRKVNHSARKTTVSTLAHSGVPSTEIMQVTGHKNVNSINHYSSASIEQQQRMSNLLSELSAGAQNIQHVQLEDVDDKDLIKASQEIEQNENVSCFEFTVPVPSTTSVPSLIDLPFTMPRSNKKSSLSCSHSLFTGANVQGGSFTININNFEAPSKKRKFRALTSDSNSE